MLSRFLLIGLVPLMIVGILSYQRSRDAILERTGSFLQLQAMAVLDRINQNLFERYRDVQTFAFNPKALGSREDIIGAANFFTTTYGVYDIMLVVDVNGAILGVNTVAHDGTPLNTSGFIGQSVKGEKWFENIVSGSVKTGESYYSDLEEDKWVARAYHNRGLTLNFSAPVFDRNGRLVRIWSNRASRKRIIGKIMEQSRQDLKDNGITTVETQVLHKTGVLVDDYDPKAIMSDFNLANAGLIAAQKAINGNSGHVIEIHKRRKIAQVNGYAASRGLAGFPGNGWSALVRQDASEVYAEIAKIRNIMIVIATIAAGIIAGLAIWFAAGLTKPLRKTVNVLETLAAGDLTTRLDINSGDELGRMGKALNTMSGKLSALVGRLQQAGIQVASSVTEIASSTREQEATATEHAATTSQVAASVKEIASTSRELGQTTEEVTHLAQATAASAADGQALLTSLDATMNRMAEASGSIADKLAALNEKAGNIGDMVTTINKVADQTNLLSLNAAIEAEKAGEYGRGFAVVATEIRRLADQTAVATYDIEQMVGEVQSAVSAGVMGMDRFSEEIHGSVVEAKQAGTQLEKIIDQTQALVPHIESVNEGLQAQVEGAGQIDEAMMNLSEAAQQSAELIRQSNDAISDLNKATRNLQEAAAILKVNS